MEGCYVPRDIRRYGSNEVSSATQFIFGIVESRNDQCDDLFPETTFVDHLYRFENVVDDAAELAIVLVVHRLQIDLVTISPGSQVIEHLRGGVTVRDECGSKAGGPRLFEN